MPRGERSRHLLSRDRFLPPETRNASGIILALDGSDATIKHPDSRPPLAEPEGSFSVAPSLSRRTSGQFNLDPPMKKDQFATLEAVYWRHIEQTCPHPKDSRHRFTWMRQNVKFDHHGIVYERRRATGMGVTGRPMHVIAYLGGDGSVHEGEQEMRSLV